MATASPESLTGFYQLHLGSVPGVSGQRPVLLAGRLPGLLQRQAIQHIPDVLGAVFTLCAHAHRRTSRQVLGLAAAPTDAPVFHLLETARDHLRSMALDWPQRLATPATGGECVGWLQVCPLSIAGPLCIATEEAAWDALAALRVWLEAHILQTDVADWLARYGGDDALARTDWFASNATRLLPARCLTQWLQDAPAEVPLAASLDVLDRDAARQTQQLRALGQQIAHLTDFAQTPTWGGQCVENGPWTRLRHRRPTARSHRPQNPSHTLAKRLASRWIDLLELTTATLSMNTFFHCERSQAIHDVQRSGLPRFARSDTDPVQSPCAVSATLLSTGVQQLEDGQTLAWCEMARGLLLHWVRRDETGRVQDYKVIAPTEWNFHPKGTLSQTLATLRADDHDGARALGAAFDPCVACTV